MARIPSVHDEDETLDAVRWFEAAARDMDARKKGPWAKYGYIARAYFDINGITVEARRNVEGRKELWFSKKSVTWSEFYHTKGYKLTEAISEVFAEQQKPDMEPEFP